MTGVSGRFRRRNDRGLDLGSSGTRPATPSGLVDLEQERTQPLLGPLLAESQKARVFSLGRFTVFRVDRDGSSTTDRALSAVRAAQEREAAVPAFFTTLTIEGLTGIAMERLEPEHLLRRLGRLPWTVQAVGRLMGETHAAIHEVPGPLDLPSPADVMAERLAGRAGLAGNLPVPPSRAELGQLLHGDFNPANLLRHPQTKRWLAVDWGGALRGDPVVDVAITLVMIQRGAPPDSMPALLTRLAPVGRRLLAAAYLREYLRHRQLDRSVLGTWQIIWSSLRSLDEMQSARFTSQPPGPSDLG